MTKDKKINLITKLLELSDLCYVDNLYKLLIQEDLYALPKVLGDDDWNTLKMMIEMRDFEECD